MSKYHTIRVKEYNIKQKKHEMYINELNRIIQKRNILFKDFKNIDNNDGTVESYSYNPKMFKVRSRLASLNGKINYLRGKVERTG